MLGFVLWVTVGALVGAFVGVYRCNDVTRVLSRSDYFLHVGFCAGVGALAGFVAFLILATFFYSPDFFKEAI
jgi:hypothetical protein